MKIIDIETWNRKEHFEFFSKMTSPYFGITTEVDCTKAYINAKENGHSFFAHYLHKSMIAANSVEELRLRIIDRQVVLFERINAGATVGRADGTLVERRLFGVVRHSVFRYVAAKSKALALHIKNGIWKARAFLLTLT